MYLRKFAPCKLVIPANCWEVEQKMAKNTSLYLGSVLWPRTSYLIFPCVMGCLSSVPRVSAQTAWLPCGPWLESLSTAPSPSFLTLLPTPTGSSFFRCCILLQQPAPSLFSLYIMPLDLVRTRMLEELEGKRGPQILLTDSRGCHNVAHDRNVDRITLLFSTWHFKSLLAGDQHWGLLLSIM